MRLAILTSHPVQYYAPLFRELAQHIDLHVFFAHDATAQEQAAAGFGQAFTWDVDLTSGYSNSFLRNVAKHPDASRFSGCDTPEIGDRLRDGGFDALLVLGWHLKSLLQGIWAAKRLGLPVLVRGDSQLGSASLPKRMVKRLAYPVLLRSFDAALYVGERSREYYRHYNYPASRLFHSPHAVDTEWFAARSGAAVRQHKRAALGLSNHDQVVMFAGKLIPVKLPLDAVRAVAALRAAGRPAKLLIAGAGPMGEAVHAEATRLDVPLIDLGFQNQTAMPPAYAAADALLLSSRHETWGLVCNEALACGTPVVISSFAGSAADLAPPDEEGGARASAAGRQYRGGDPADAARALAALFDDPPSVAAIAALSQRFGLTAASQGVIDALAALRAR